MRALAWIGGYLVAFALWGLAELAISGTRDLESLWEAGGSLTGVLTATLAAILVGTAFRLGSDDGPYRSFGFGLIVGGVMPPVVLLLAVAAWFGMPNFWWVVLAALQVPALVLFLSQPETQHSDPENGPGGKDTIRFP